MDPEGMKRVQAVGSRKLDLIQEKTHMAWQKPTNFPDLHKKLYAVMKGTDPISKRVEDIEGVWKAIDAEGNVYLVAWWKDEQGRWHRSQKLQLDAKQVSQQFAEEESGRPKPHEAWSPFAD